MVRVAQRINVVFRKHSYTYTDFDSHQRWIAALLHFDKTEACAIVGDRIDTGAVILPKGNTDKHLSLDALICVANCDIARTNVTCPSV